MTFGEIREFDFYPFYVRIGGGKVPVPLSDVATLMMSGRIDATPYPYSMVNAIPRGYVRLPYGLALGPEARDLLFVSSKPLSEIRSLGVVKGYEFVLHLLEGVLRVAYGISLRSVKISIFSDVSPGTDAFIIYGDAALRGDYGDFRYSYNLCRTYNDVRGEPLKVAVWIARREVAEEAERHIGNSLAHWMLRRDELTLKYARSRRLPEELLLTHARALIFGMTERPP